MIYNKFKCLNMKNKLIIELFRIIESNKTIFNYLKLRNAVELLLIFKLTIHDYLMRGSYFEKQFVYPLIHQYINL